MVQSKYSAARPSLAGEAFARDREQSSSSHVKFDVRNPSALAPGLSADDDDENGKDVVLDADVIGKVTGTKRGAINIDGYDSDSENETFNARAEARNTTGGGGKRKRKGGGGRDGGGGEPDVDIADQLDNYDKNLRNGGSRRDDVEEEAEDGGDMFAGSDDDPDGDEPDGGDPAAPGVTATSSKKKEVRFLDATQIQGQETTSKSGGHIHITNTTPAAAGADSDGDDVNISDEEEARALAIQEEGVDEEVGAGGLKHHAPRIDAFNMKDEQEEGAFDETGTFIRRAADPDAVHDKWMEGLSKKDMKAAAAAHEKRQAELRQKRKDDDSLITSDLMGDLIGRLEPGETVLEALARLGRKRKGVSKVKKPVPKWRLKKMAEKNGAQDSMDVDKEKEVKDEEQVAVEEAVEAITEAADKLLGREYTNIYDTEREKLMREYSKETGEDWKEACRKPQAATVTSNTEPNSWEYRWVDGRDGNSKQGPYDGPTMQAWKDAGFFGEGVEFRPAGESNWSRVATFI